MSVYKQMMPPCSISKYRDIILTKDKRVTGVISAFSVNEGDNMDFTLEFPFVSYSRKQTPELNLGLMKN